MDNVTSAPSAVTSVVPLKPLDLSRVSAADLESLHSALNLASEEQIRATLEKLRGLQASSFFCPVDKDTAEGNATILEVPSGVSVLELASVLRSLGLDGTSDSKLKAFGMSAGRSEAAALSKVESKVMEQLIHACARPWQRSDPRRAVPWPVRKESLDKLLLNGRKVADFAMCVPMVDGTGMIGAWADLETALTLLEGHCRGKGDVELQAGWHEVEMGMDRLWQSLGNMMRFYPTLFTDPVNQSATLEDFEGVIEMGADDEVKVVLPSAA